MSYDSSFHFLFHYPYITPIYYTLYKPHNPHHSNYLTLNPKLPPQEGTKENHRLELCATGRPARVAAKVKNQLSSWQTRCMVPLK